MVAHSFVSLHVLFVHGGMVINAFAPERALEHACIRGALLGVRF